MVPNWNRVCPSVSPKKTGHLFVKNKKQRRVSTDDTYYNTKPNKLEPSHCHPIARKAKQKSVLDFDAIEVLDEKHLQVESEMLTGRRSSMVGFHSNQDTRTHSSRNSVDSQKGKLQNFIF